jgi:NACalpha-BTF3-like transcription factor
MTADEGDGDTTLECTINFDDVELVSQQAGLLG